MNDREIMQSDERNSEDSRLLALGYQPQFRRVLGLFADFSLGYSYMSPMAGVFALFSTALMAAGPAFFWTMPVVLAGQAFVCLVFAEAASAYPIAGGIYQWARQLGGTRWGFLTAWIYLFALVGTAAGIAAGGAPFLASLLGAPATPTFNAIAGIAIAGIAIMANFAGTRVLAKATEVGVWAGIVGLIVCGVYMLFFARVQPLSIIWNSYNIAHGNYTAALFSAGLIGIWIFYGFEACGDLAEEVDGASHAVPRAMLLTIVCGGTSALLMTVGLLFAIPDLAGALSGKVADPASAAIQQAMGPLGLQITMVCLLAVVVSAVASVIASISRLMFSLGRDNMIVGARFLGRLSGTRQQPVPAIWTTSTLTILVLSVGFISANAATQIISFATTGIYAAFQMVVLASLVSSLRGWRSDGAFQLGAKGIVIKIIALAFGVASIIDLAWPRTPEAGWFANWLIVISLVVIVLAGLIQMAKLELPSNRLTIE
ncbi:amino acid/polyamine/organocation transporter, APC superfamily [Paraburkholderia diazotrophica]|uniref:Amino acid/polyamine/organocation transporter, APC superfamily n=2 Tax=Paraburkholderia diazotrophica TaxID=667676 RepID=A0A1H7EKJ9_9BURK|nr:amino acid/polyamine/organocation transporter, APC superfamily [Paraburkholderia diazotrophica]